MRLQSIWEAGQRGKNQGMAPPDPWAHIKPTLLKLALQKDRREIAALLTSVGGTE